MSWNNQYYPTNPQYPPNSFEFPGTVNTGYPPNAYPTNPGYPPSNYQPSPSYPRSTTGYPPSNPTGYPPNNPTGYPPSNPTGYPPTSQSINTGYPSTTNTGYPPTSQPTYPSSTSGYPPSNPTGYPPTSQPGYSSTVSATPQNYAQPGYPPTQNTTFPSTQQTGYPPSGYPPTSNNTTNYNAPTNQPSGYPPTTNTRVPSNPSSGYPPTTNTTFNNTATPSFPPPTYSPSPTLQRSPSVNPNQGLQPKFQNTTVQPYGNTMVPTQPVQVLNPPAPQPTQFTNVPQNNPPLVNPYMVTQVQPTQPQQLPQPTQFSNTNTNVQPNPMTNPFMLTQPQPSGLAASVNSAYNLQNNPTAPNPLRPMRGPSQLQSMLIEKQQAENDAMRGLNKNITNTISISASPLANSNSAYRQSVMIAVNKQAEMLEKKRQEEMDKQRTIKLATESIDNKMLELEKLKQRRNEAREQKKVEDTEMESKMQLQKLEQERFNNLQQSFYSLILEHLRSIASNTHNVHSYFRESFDDLLDANSIATELLNERITVITNTIKVIESDLKENLQFINGPIYDALSSKTKVLEQSIKSLVEYGKKLVDPAQLSAIKAEPVGEIEAKNKKIFLAIFLAVKELIAEFETQKMSSDTVKEVLETTSYDINFLTSEIVIVAPRPKLERIYPVKALEMSSYDANHVKALQLAFKKLAGPAMMRNLVQEYKASQSSRKARTRINILFEFLSTEETYVNALKKAVTFWLRPLQSEVRKKTPIISDAQIVSLFSSIETIVQINEGLLAKMQARLSKYPIETKFGDLLVEMAPTLKLYVDYVNKFDDAMVTFGELSKNNQRFAEFLQTAKTSAAINLDLASILIMPVQRIPRYELLLRELIKCTTEMHVDWNNLQKAQKEIQSINLYINAQKLKQDTNRKLVLAEKTIVSNIPLVLVVPHRLYIHDGKVEFLHNAKRVPGHLYLLNDIVIITVYSTTLTQIQHTFVEQYYLNHVTFNEVSKDNFSLTIRTDDQIQNLDFWCQPGELAKWVKEFKEAISTYTLKKILDIQVQNTNLLQKEFAILEAKYGVLNRTDQCKDVTDQVIKICMMQGGDQLLLKSETKSVIFGNPAPKSRKQFQVTCAVKGSIKIKVFQDTDAVNISAKSF